MLRLLSKLDSAFLTVVLATSSYFFVYGYFVKGMFSWGSMLLMLLMIRELVRKGLGVGNTTVTKSYDEMEPREKGFSLLLKTLVYTVWAGFVLLAFYDDGEHLHSPYVSIFYGLIFLCMIMDVMMYRIRKRNHDFLKDDTHDL